MDDDDWQEMPVVRDENVASSSSDEGGSSYNSTFRKNKNSYSARKAYSHGRSNSGYTNFIGQTQPGQLSGATNATGRHLDIDDARSTRTAFGKVQSRLANVSVGLKWERW